MSLSERLKLPRKQAGMTQVQLAELVGVSQPVITDLEAGKASGSSHIVKIASALGVDPHWLDSGQAESNVDNKNLNKREIALLTHFRLLGETDKKVVERIASSLQTLK